MLFISSKSMGRAFVSHHRQSLKLKCEFLASCPCLLVRSYKRGSHVVTAACNAAIVAVAESGFSHCGMAQHLTTAEIEALARVFEYHTYYPGGTVFREGDPIDPLRCAVVHRHRGCLTFVCPVSPSHGKQRCKRSYRDVYACACASGALPLTGV